MKRWKKYVLCVMCVCCFGLLTGCGNQKKENEIGQGTGTESKGNLSVPQTDRLEEKTEKNLGNDASDQKADSIGDNLGNAADDLIDGAGEAGKDVIDGVEDAGDALTGNEENGVNSDAADADGINP